MNFLKGVMIGTMVTASAMIMYSDSLDTSKKKMMKKSKQFMRKMGF